MSQKFKAKSSIVYSVIIIILSGLFINSRGENDIVYLIAGVSIFVLLVFLLGQNKVLFITDKLVFLPLLMMCVWIYGMVLGFLKQNNISYIIRNFAGNAFYVFFYFFLLLRVDAKKCIRICVYISRFIVLLTLLSYLDMFVIGTKYVMGIPLLSNFQQAATIEYGAREMIYVSYLYSLVGLLEEQKYRVFNLFWVLLCGVVELICIRSGGDTLAFGLITILALYRFSYKRVREKRSLFVIAVFLGIAIVLIPGSPLRKVFSRDDIGNEERYEQIQYLSDHVSLLGHGLGATFSDGIGTAYAVEIIYFDLVHKFGVFAVVFYLAYMITLIEALKLCFYKNGEHLDVLPVACMGYLVPSLANPMLFNSVCVLSHSIALYYIIDRRNKREAQGVDSRNEFL